MRKTKTWIILVLGVLLPVLLIFAQGYKVGSIIKDFTLPDVTGKKVALSDYKDAKGSVIVFTCNACPFSKLYDGRLKELNAKYKAMGFPLITINPNDPNIQPEDSYEKMKEKAQEKKFEFPYLFDENQKLSSDFSPLKTPHAFVIAVENNNYKIVYSGAIDDNPSNANAVTTNYIENTLKELLAGKKVSVTSSKPVGCTVKWKKQL